MSAITDRCRAYKAGAGETWEILRDWLATRRYPDPARYYQERDALAENDDDLPYTDGTWDEVRRCYRRGLLTTDEYFEVVGLADATVAAGTLRR